jgi:hypothetical protein
MPIARFRRGEPADKAAKRDTKGSKSAIDETDGRAGDRAHDAGSWLLFIEGERLVEPRGVEPLTS